MRFVLLFISLFKQKLENAPVVDRTFEVQKPVALSTAAPVTSSQSSISASASSGGDDLNLLDLGSFAAPALPAKAGLGLRLMEMTPQVH